MYGGPGRATQRPASNNVHLMHNIRLLKKLNYIWDEGPSRSWVRALPSSAHQLSSQLKTSQLVDFVSCVSGGRFDFGTVRLILFGTNYVKVSVALDVWSPRVSLKIDLTSRSAAADFWRDTGARRDDCQLCVHDDRMREQALRACIERGYQLGESAVDYATQTLTEFKQNELNRNWLRLQKT